MPFYIFKRGKKVHSGIYILFKISILKSLYIINETLLRLFLQTHGIWQQMKHFGRGNFQNINSGGHEITSKFCVLTTFFEVISCPPELIFWKFPRPKYFFCCQMPWVWGNTLNNVSFIIYKLFKNAYFGQNIYPWMYLLSTFKDIKWQKKWLALKSLIREPFLGPMHE